MKPFFLRQREARGEIPDVYEYDHLPDPLRVQFCYLIDDIISSKHHHIKAQYQADLAKTVVKYLCRELGVFKLSQDIYTGNRLKKFRDYIKEFKSFLLDEEDVDYVLTAIEFFFQKVREDSPYVSELNKRFRLNGVGYQFEGMIIRIDNQLIHKEVMKPALLLLSSECYAGAQEEFLSAHSHYRNGDHQEALVGALKSIESTIKVICGKQGFSYNPNDPIKKLLKVCFDNQLIPSFWQSHMSGLRSVLEGGVPTARNKLGGHGQGADVVEVPDHLASYVLHMTASTIVFLVESERNY